MTLGCLALCAVLLLHAAHAVDASRSLAPPQPKTDGKYVASLKNATQKAGAAAKGAANLIKKCHWNDKKEQVCSFCPPGVVADDKPICKITYKKCDKPKPGKGKRCTKCHRLGKKGPVKCKRCTTIYDPKLKKQVKKRCVKCQRVSRGKYACKRGAGRGGSRRKGRNGRGRGGRRRRGRNGRKGRGGRKGRKGRGRKGRKGRKHRKHRRKNRKHRKNRRGRKGGRRRRGRRGGKLSKIGGGLKKLLKKGKRVGKAAVAAVKNLARKSKEKMKALKAKLKNSKAGKVAAALMQRAKMAHKAENADAKRLAALLKKKSAAKPKKKTSILNKPLVNNKWATLQSQVNAAAAKAIADAQAQAQQLLKTMAKGKCPTCKEDIPPPPEDVEVTTVPPKTDDDLKIEFEAKLKELGVHDKLAVKPHTLLHARELDVALAPAHQKFVGQHEKNCQGTICPDDTNTPIQADEVPN